MHFIYDENKKNVEDSIFFIANEFTTQVAISTPLKNSNIIEFVLYLKGMK